MDDYSLFTQLVYKKSGIDLSAYKEKQMKRRIGSLAARRGFQSSPIISNALTGMKDSITNSSTISQ